MAGGNLFSSSFKKPTNEVLFENQAEHHQSQKEYSPDEFFKRFFAEFKHKERILFDRHEQETQEEIAKIRNEINNLKNSLPETPQELDIAVSQNVVEASNYQISFFEKARQTLISLKEDASSIDAWQEQFCTRKRSKGKFNDTLNSKHGGGQYLGSGEHAVARSAN